LFTHSNDNLPDGGRPLIFRLAAQTDAGGAATAGLRGSLTVARLRVLDAPLTAAEVSALYAAESATYAPPALPPEFTGVLFDPAANRLTLRWAAPASGAYNLEGAPGIGGAWTPVASGLTGSEFQVEGVSGLTDRYYRLVRP
jgi:hypothetical protein